MSFLDPVLNPVLEPLVNCSPFWAIVILSFVVSFLSTIAYKYFTDQEKMKNLKMKQKEYQKQMKELRSQPETYSLTAFFKESATGNAELIAGEGTEVLNGVSQGITGGVVTWNLRSQEGDHSLTVKLGQQEGSTNVRITKDVHSAEPLTTLEHSDIEKLQINYKPLKPLGEMSFFGWQPGWLGLYFIFSLVSSLLFRKLLKIY